MRVSFSNNILNIALPRGWHELSPSELAMVYRYFVTYDASVVKTAIFCCLANARIIKERDNKFLVSFRVSRKMCVETHISSGQMEAYISNLAWLDAPGEIPVRLQKIAGNTAVNAQFHGVSFGDYLRIESLYQGYLSSKDDAALLRLANILYRGRNPLRHLEDVARINIINWVAQVKALFSSTFPHFFTPAGDVGGEAPDMMSAMNSQIRALTGGDVAKEETILAIDCWRALTELDAKCKETEDFNRKYNKK